MPWRKKNTPAPLKEDHIREKLSGSFDGFHQFVIDHYEELKQFRTASDGCNLLHIALEMAFTPNSNHQSLIACIERITQAMHELIITPDKHSLCPWDYMRNRTPRFHESLDLATTTTSLSEMPHRSTIQSLSYRHCVDTTKSTVVPTTENNIARIQSILKTSLNEMLGSANESGNTKSVTQLLDYGANPNAAIRGDETAMGLAAQSFPKKFQPQQTSSEVYKLNQAYGGWPSTFSHNDHQGYVSSWLYRETLILMLAIEEKNVEECRQWCSSHPIRLKPDINECHPNTFSAPLDEVSDIPPQNMDSSSIMHKLAALDSSEEGRVIAKCVIEFFNHPPINPEAFSLSQDNQGNTALHIAASQNNHFILNFLLNELRQSPALLTKNNDGQLPHDMASGEIKTLTMKQTQGMKLFYKLNSLQPQSIINIFSSELKDFTNHLGDNILMYAARYCPPERFKLFHERVAANLPQEMNKVNYDQKNYWHFMAQYQCQDFVQCLKANTVPKEITEGMVFHPVHEFFRWANNDALQDFLKAYNAQHISIDYMSLAADDSELGMKPLHRLVDNTSANAKTIAQCLLTCYADTIMDQCDQTPYHLIVQDDKQAILQAIAEHHGPDHSHHWMTAKTLNCTLIETCSPEQIKTLGPILQPHHLKDITQTSCLHHALIASPIPTDTILQRLWHLRPGRMILVKCIRFLTLPIQLLGWILGLFTWNKKADAFLTLGDFKRGLSNGWIFQQWSYPKASSLKKSPPGDFHTDIPSTRGNFEYTSSNTLLPHSHSNELKVWGSLL